MRQERLLQTAVWQEGFDDFTSLCLSFFICQMRKVTVPAMQSYRRLEQVSTVLST